MDAALAGLILGKFDWTKYQSLFTYYNTNSNGNYQTVLSVSGKGYIDMITAYVNGQASTANKNLYIKVTIDGSIWTWFGIRNTSNGDIECVIAIAPFLQLS